jgi:hypothetical protein
MTKLDWNRQDWKSTMNSEYWTNPKTGFDKAWHEQQKHKAARIEKEKQFLGVHADHDLDRIPLQSGPHAGKLVCKTCNNKFLKWLSKEAF